MKDSAGQIWWGVHSENLRFKTLLPILEERKDLIQCYWSPHKKYLAILHSPNRNNFSFTLYQVYPEYRQLIDRSDLFGYIFAKDSGVLSSFRFNDDMADKPSADLSLFMPATDDAAADNEGVVSNFRISLVGEGLGKPVFARPRTFTGYKTWNSTHTVKDRWNVIEEHLARDEKSELIKP